MGITAFDIEILTRTIARSLPRINSVCELGSQNLYIDDSPLPPFASNWYKDNGIDYASIDLGGDNNSLKYDLSYPIIYPTKYDLITDFGTSEHCVQMEGYQTVSFLDGHIQSIYPQKVKNIEEGYYYCWLNKHNLLKTGYYMINMNPLTGNWPGHGYSYLGELFYEELIKISGYEIIESGTHAACNNIIDGWNLYSVLRKTSDQFPSFEEFHKLPINRQ